jgi:hypothetical protein
MPFWIFLMDFELTPIEAQALAKALVELLPKGEIGVSVEKAIDPDAPYRTTLIAPGAICPQLIEVQATPAFNDSLRILVGHLAQRRTNCEFYIATGIDASLSAKMLHECGKWGVGLILIEDGKGLHWNRPATNHAYVVSADPTLKYGRLNNAVTLLFVKFNGGQRKDAFRDFCELFEQLVGAVLDRALARGHLKPTITQQVLDGMDLNGKIDTLFSANAWINTNHLTDNKLKADLHSFRGARNLVDHPVKTVAANRSRQQQLVERMPMAARLLSVLITFERTL